MHALAEYADPAQLAAAIADWHRVAERRAAACPDRDRVVSAAVSDVVAEGGYDDLLLGWVDAVSWERRERLSEEVTARLVATILPYRSIAGHERLLADHLELELLARFPYLSDAFQESLAAFERDWGFRRDLGADIQVPGLTDAPRLLRLQRAPAWRAARVSEGDSLPASFDVLVDRGVPRADVGASGGVDSRFLAAVDEFVEATSAWNEQLRKASRAVMRRYDYIGMSAVPWDYLCVRPIDRQRS